MGYFKNLSRRLHVKTLAKDEVNCICALCNSLMRNREERLELVGQPGVGESSNRYAMVDVMHLTIMIGTMLLS